MPRVIEAVPRRERIAVCPNCGRTVAYVQNDVKSRTTRDYTGCSDTDYYVRCPATDCRKEIPVKGY